GDGRGRAVVLGLSLRLGYALGGAAPELPAHVRLELRNGRIGLELGPERRTLAGDSVGRRLGALGRAGERPTALLPCAVRTGGRGTLRALFGAVSPHRGRKV